MENSKFQGIFQGTSFFPLYFKDNTTVICNAKINMQMKLLVENNFRKTDKYEEQNNLLLDEENPK